MAFDFDFLPFDDFPLFTQAIVNTFHILPFGPLLSPSG